MTEQSLGSRPPTGAVVERLAQVRERIANAGGNPAQVDVVAVTKTFDAQACHDALAAGVSGLGENYADELIAKATAVGAAHAGAPVGAAPSGAPEGPAHAHWHFLGSIQRNKVARIAPYVSLWQSVDRVEEGVAIARHAPGASVLVEVEASGLPGRGGVIPAQVHEVVDALQRLGLDVRGLMTVAPPLDADVVASRDRARRAFATVAGLCSDLGLTTVSMGMSEDLELAVAEGSTMVRIGRALFGPRPSPGQVQQ